MRRNLRRVLPLACVCIAATVAAAGCRPREVLPPLDEAGLEKAFAERREAIRTMSVKVNLAIYDRARDKGGRVSGTYLVGPDNEFRFRTLGGMGTVLFDMAVRGGKLRLSVPVKQRFVEGSINDVPESKKEMSYLLLKELAGELLFFPKLRDERAQLVRFVVGGRSYVVSSQEKSGPLWKVRREAWVRRSDNTTEKILFYGPRGVFVGKVQYFDYEPIEGTNVPCPRRILIENATGSWRIEFQIEGVKANVDLAAEKFHVPDPDAPDTVRMRLYDLFQAGQGLWPEGD
ncbi:MAG: hypothetical protein N3A38_01380 [Planctomycetota bacterium]|nr:hypothetical protein [Planctomycetota bacterium]